MVENAVKSILEPLKDLPGVSREDYIKAVTIANKAVSTNLGNAKMLKTAEMTDETRLDRDIILRETVRLMTAHHKDEGFSVSAAIYAKFCPAEPVKPFYAAQELVQCELPEMAAFTVAAHPDLTETSRIKIRKNNSRRRVNP
jgi:hypothetical protein